MNANTTQTETQSPLATRYVDAIKLLEILFGLARKAHDKRSANRNARNRFPRVWEMREIPQLLAAKHA